METSVDLGFLEKREPWLLTNKFFPSKMGGRPAWLDLEKIPDVNTLKCNECTKELVFLCQIYAPLDDFDYCFHRTIYIFICINPSCWHPNNTRTIKALRCQLPRQNKFYDFEPSSEEIVTDEIPSSVHLCLVCGCRGPLSCGKCKLAHYCGSTHQKIDWTLGEHKKLCGTESISCKSDTNTKHNYLLDEYELVTEPEQESAGTETETEDQAEVRRLKDYEEFLEKQRSTITDVDLKDVADEEFQKYANQIDEDVVFGKFKKRIESEKDQVVRFDRNGSPLWITNKNILNSTDVPTCERCNKNRVFEFQIMPQLLNYLHNTDLDWGIIAIYTCEDSCDTNGEYVPEFVFKQDIVEVTDSNK